jgi:Flp pilus assembly protein TadG
MKSRLGGHENGQSMVIIAVAMIGMIAMAALVMDGGYAYLQRRRVQNAADAAAVAGARALAGRQSSNAAAEQAILREINLYAERNGVADTNGVAGDATNANVDAYFVNSSNAVVGTRMGTNGGVPVGALSVVVHARESHSTFFAPAIGMPTLSTAAVAQATFDIAGSVFGPAPIAITDTTFLLDHTYTIWDSEKAEDPSDPTLIPGGNRGWIRFTGFAGAEDLRWLMENGYPGTIAVGDVLPGEPGNKLGVFNEAASWEGRTFIIPIYDRIVSGGYRISGFGAFVVTGSHKNGNGSAIVGQFKQRFVGVSGGGTLNMGVGTLRLTPPAAIP